MTHDGDTDLHDELLPSLGRHRWAAAVVMPSNTRVVTHDMDLTAGLEVGSVSKGITGLLYADSLERREVSPDDRLADHLPLGSSPAGTATLASLSTHTSGLPSLPTPGLSWSRSARWLVKQENPYGDTLDELLEQVQRTKLGKAGRPVYSNIGFQLLGHAVAAAAGLPYRALVRRRVAEPLGLASLTVPASRDELGPADVIGRSRYGRIAQPWTGEALAPAGGIRMDISDVSRLMTSLLDGTALLPASAHSTPSPTSSARATASVPHGSPHRRSEVT